MNQTRTTGMDIADCHPIGISSGIPGSGVGTTLWGAQPKPGVPPEMASFTQYLRWAFNLTPRNIVLSQAREFKLSARRACAAAPCQGYWVKPPFLVGWKSILMNSQYIMNLKNDSSIPSFLISNSQRGRAATKKGATGTGLKLREMVVIPLLSGALPTGA